MQKIIAVEPIMDFDVEILASWIRATEPKACYISYDSKHNYLPEPELKKVRFLIMELRK